MTFMHKRPWCTLIERDVAEIERRLRLYRENCPKRICQDMGVHINTVTTINLGRHPVQARLAAAPSQVSTLCSVCDQIKELHPGTHEWTARREEVSHG